MSGSFAPPSSGGGSVDLTAPGVIGGTTPNIVNATNLINSGTVIQTPTSSQTLIASTTISPNAGTVLITAASAITMTSNPQITAGSNGQVIDLVNVGSNTITFTTNGIIWGQSSYPLYPGKIVRLKYLSTYSNWVYTENTPQDLVLPGVPTTSTLVKNSNSTGLATTAYVNTANRPNVSASRITSTQTGFTNGAWFTVVYNSESVDSDNAYSTSTGEFTVPTGMGGLYQIFAGVGTDNNCNVINLAVFVNGTVRRYLSDIRASGDTLIIGIGGGIVSVSAGDVITVRMLQTNTGSASRGVVIDPKLSFLDIIRLNT